MKTKLLTLVIVVALLLAGVQMTSAQPRPTIITFESSLKTISMADAEAGAKTTTLTWHTAGVTDEYKLVLHYYVLDGWELAFSPDGVPLEADGARIVTVRHPLTFGAPTYLLSIVRSDSNKIVDQRTLSIPYDVSASATPEIDSLEADVDEIDPAELEAGTARVMLAWSVSNRPPTANLMFDQLLSDDIATSVELPRLVMWVPSVAQGPVAPVYEADMESITLRLRVVDAVTDDVYAEETLTIPVTVEEPATAPDADEGDSDTGTDAGTGEETETDVTPGPDTSQPSSKVVVFTASPATVTPGAAVTLTWDVQGADSVSITQTVPNVTATPVVVEAQSPKGTAEVYLPDYAAYSVIYTLTTPDGQASAQADVTVHCPYTYFFGAGEGCPSGEAFEVGAVYQEFENGYMLWRSDTNDVYVLFDDGSARYFVEANYANLPDPALDQMPPLDRQSPSEGFGKVWANAAGIRDQLGWALDDEIGYNATIQGVALTRDPRPSVSFYMTLPDDTVVGSGFGTWRSVP